MKKGGLSYMNCILPLIFSVPLVVVLAGGMTALATVLEGIKNSDTLYGTTANDIICNDIDLKNCKQEVTSRAGVSPSLSFP